MDLTGEHTKRWLERHTTNTVNACEADQVSLKLIPITPQRFLKHTVAQRGRVKPGLIAVCELDRVGLVCSEFPIADRHCARLRDRLIDEIHVAGQPILAKRCDETGLNHEHTAHPP